VAPTFRAGFGSSDSKENPLWSEDHFMVDPVLMKSPLKFCASLTIVARAISSAD
jgi:hypothetical protein